LFNFKRNRQTALPDVDKVSQVWICHVLGVVPVCEIWRMLDKMFDDAYILIRILGGIRGFGVVFQLLSECFIDRNNGPTLRGDVNNLPILSGMKGFEVELRTTNNN
jgi:hypothetical protein